MPNPFNITEVDIPGALGAYETGQNNRLLRMARQQQVAAAEREADRRQRFDEILLGNATRPDGKSGAAGAYAPQTGQQAASGIAPAAGAPPPTAPAAPPPQPSGLPELTPDVMRTLAVLDPEQAGQIFTTLRTMDTAQRERMSAANLYLGNFAQHLRGVPLAQRQAEIQRRAPDLLAHGITQEQIQGFTPDDTNLDYVIQSAMDVERLASRANPHPVPTTQGGSVVDTNSIDPQTGQARVLYESPTISGPGGETYPRPPAASGRPQPQTAINPRTGQRLQLNPQTNQWEPMPVEAPAFRPAPGGAAAGQQGFQ